MLLQVSLQISGNWYEGKMPFCSLPSQLHKGSKVHQRAEVCVHWGKSAIGYLRDVKSVKELFVSVHLVYSGPRLNIAHEQFRICETEKHAVTFLALYILCR